MKFSVITSTYNQLHLLKKVAPYWEAQTFKDFEWIIADDGSSDEVLSWVTNYPHIIGAERMSFVTQPKLGYRLTRILNNAAKVARGEHLVWVMGDSYPKEDFLQNLADVAQSDRMINGVRLNVNPDGKIVSPDWRIDRAPFPVVSPVCKVEYVRPWELMTLNTMSMPAEAYKRLGGLYGGYDVGYGKMDWDLAANAHFHGLGLYWAPDAIVYHYAHPDREDTPESTEIFNKRLEEFKNL